MGPGFSPLDETLGLLSGVAFTPWLVESIVRLGTLLPFAQAPEILKHFTGVTVSAATVRRLTEVAGAMQEQVERCLLYTSPSPRDRTRSRMPSSA